MRNILKSKSGLAALGLSALALGLIVLGCSGDSSGGSGVKDVGNSVGNSLSNLGNASSSMLNNIGHGMPANGSDTNLFHGNTPMTGNQNLNLLMTLGKQYSDAVELDNPERQNALGQACALAISNKYPLLANANKTDYVNYVGLTIAAVCPKPELDYTFGVLDTPDINAYSTPGGYVFITRGALEMCSDESELAAVLAHEIAHVVLGHGIDAIRSAKYTQIVMTVADARSKEFRQFEQLTDNGVENALNGIHSNKQENDADSNGVNYLIAAGYDPNGMTRFLQKLQAKTGAGGIENVMKNHPGTAYRVKQVQQQIAASSIQTGATLPDRFAQWTK